MSKVYKCDICLGYYDNISYLNIGGRDYPHLRINNVSGNIVDHIDVCPDCTEAIQKTIDLRHGTRTYINAKEKET